MTLDNEEVVDRDEFLYHEVLDHFEDTYRDGSFVTLATLKQIDPGLDNVEWREFGDRLKARTHCYLEQGRENGEWVVYYRPLAPYKKRLHDCHEQADENGNTSPTLIKLFLQEFVLLAAPYRVVVQIALNEDMTRAIRNGTIRRAKVDALLFEALKAFKVAEREVEGD